MAPSGCQLTATIDTETWIYPFYSTGWVSHIAQHSANNDLDYAYAYQGRQATIDITDSRFGNQRAAFSLQADLDREGLHAHRFGLNSGAIQSS